MEIFYRIGTAGEQELFDGERETYDGIVVGAHVAAYGKTWIAGLLSRTGKPYVVDPVTYVFAQDPKIVLREDEVRRSYDELANAYGGAIRQHAGKRAVRASDLTRKDQLEELASNTLEFEKRIFSGDPAQTSLMEYLAELGEVVPGFSPPKYLIPPYFYVNSVEDPFYDVNVRLLEAVLNHVDRSRVAPVFCTSQRAPGTEAAMAKIVEDYARYPATFVWVSALDEQKSPQSALYAYGRLVQRLSNAGGHPRAFFGGPFSLGLATVGLEGLSPGVCYSESKDVALRATGGGFPPRYYVPSNRTKVVLANAARLFASNPDLACGCTVCREVLPAKATAKKSAGPDIAAAIQGMKQQEAKRHFMHVRKGEITDVRAHSASSYAARLEAEARRAKRRNTHLFRVPYAQLDLWATVLHRLAR